MAASAQYTVGTTPVLLASAPSNAYPGAVGWFYLTNGSGAAIFLGASGVTSSNGAQVAASTTLTGLLFPGDAVYACTASSTSTVGVLQTGS